MGIRDSISSLIHGRGTGVGGSQGSSGEEPLPGYDRTPELELIDDLHLHSQAELEVIENYERSNASRTRVLNKIHFLRQGEPIAGYDDMTIDEIGVALEAADLMTIKHIRGYERKFHNRPAVQEKVEAARRKREDELADQEPGYTATSYGPSVSDANHPVPGPGRLAAGKALVTRFYAEAINAHDVEAVDRLLSEDYVENGEARGRAGQRRALADLFAAFPDLRTETELILAEGDLVSAHQRWTGTHQGAVGDQEPSGRSVELTSTAILRVHDGLITEAWGEVDLARLTAG